MQIRLVEVRTRPDEQLRNLQKSRGSLRSVGCVENATTQHSDWRLMISVLDVDKNMRTTFEKDLHRVGVCVLNAALERVPQHHRRIATRAVDLDELRVPVVSIVAVLCDDNERLEMLAPHAELGESEAASVRQ